MPRTTNTVNSETMPSVAMNRLATQTAAPQTPAMISHLQREIIKLQRELMTRDERIGQLETLVTEDDLTGLLNRRGFDDVLKQRWGAWERYRHHGALVMIDLNKFKEINDTFGHQQGDKALVHAANILRRATRSSDVVARLGGDEFVIILEEIHNGALEAKIAELASAFERAPLGIGQYLITLSASFGVVEFKDVTSVAGLVASADQKMYKNKQNNR
jgi:diguanylate cyclase (GGDEF)-like protein